MTGLSKTQRWGWFIWSGLMIPICVWAILNYFPDKMLLVFLWGIALTLNTISFLAFWRLLK